MPDDLPLPNIETWSWDQLSEEYQHLAYEAYQNYRANPEYYESLFWNDPSNPELAKLQIWAEYAENKSLHLFMKLDPYAYEEQKVEQAQQLLASGEIDEEEYVLMITSSMLALGLMDIRGDLGQWRGRTRSNQTRNYTAPPMSEDEALDVATFWLGKDYDEIAPGVFRSQTYPDRQFRMTGVDLEDAVFGPHVHFERIGPDGREILENWHVPIQ